jgi:hypothetical protein
MSKLDSIVEDVYGLLQNGKEVSEENLDILGENIKDILRRRLADAMKEGPRKGSLRASSVGKPDRQLWYSCQDNISQEDLAPHMHIKFAYGDIIEELLLFLVREAGHEVSGQQQEITLNGVKGHIDSIIDGHVVDVKSASKFAFKKFRDGTLPQDDPFGYMSQIAVYSEALGLPGAFLAMNKETGEIALLKYSRDELEFEFPEAKIDHKRAVLSSPVPPERCYSDEPDGKSGNRKLAMGCTFCAFKDECWKDANDGQGLRVFEYAGGRKVYLTQTSREPRVKELKE